MREKTYVEKQLERIEKKIDALGKKAKKADDK